MPNGNVDWIAGFIWGIADDVLRDVYVRGKYRDVILPMTVIRRLDAVLEPTKKAVLKLEEYAMQVEVLASQKSSKGYQVTLRWLSTPKGKKATKIVERTTKLDDGRLISPYVYNAEEATQTLYLVLDVAPPWEEDPVA